MNVFANFCKRNFRIEGFGKCVETEVLSLYTEECVTKWMKTTDVPLKALCNVFYDFFAGKLSVSSVVDITGRQR